MSKLAIILSTSFILILAIGLTSANRYCANTPCSGGNSIYKF